MRHSFQPYEILAPMNLQLAQKHYQSRFLELRDLIMAEESKFKLGP
jgi:bromodomain-containing protein 8